VVLALKPLRRGPHKASQLVLGLTLTIVYLLLLPVLWSFVLNGTLVTWTLPEMAGMFLGFISLIQVLVVAVIGLVLTGLSALIAALSSPRRRNHT
jgi:multisubunit Na+/H+ antiporter MnhB subunit